MYLQLSPFKKALVISLAAHTVIFFNVPRIREFKRALVPKKNIEVTYYEIKPPKVKSQAEAGGRPQKFEKMPQLASAPKILERPIPQREEDKLAPLLQEGPVLPKDEELTQDKKEAYLDYYQTVRERIRSEAERNFTSHFATGGVYLTFALFRDGTLKDVKIQEGSCPIEYLRGLALESVRVAAPYPHFPEKLKQEEIYFNVLISFELEVVK